VVIDVVRISTHRFRGASEAGKGNLGHIMYTKEVFDLGLAFSFKFEDMLSAPPIVGGTCVYLNSRVPTEVLIVCPVELAEFCKLVSGNFHADLPC
jgi:hypothetical protein